MKNLIVWAKGYWVLTSHYSSFFDTSFLSLYELNRFTQLNIFFKKTLWNIQNLNNFSDDIIPSNVTKPVWQVFFTSTLQDVFAHRRIQWPFIVSQNIVHSSKQKNWISIYSIVFTFQIKFSCKIVNFEKILVKIAN